MDKVVLVTVDSLRADHVGYHGYERDVTPMIDEYARRGSRFTNAFAHAGGTRMSFPGILTGVTPLMYGGHGRVSAEQTIISEVFQEAGYATGGYHSNLYLSDQFGYDRGWDDFYDSRRGDSFLTKARSWVKANLDGVALSVLQRGYNYLESAQGINVGSYHVPADEITDRAIEFVERTGDGPAFLWVHYMDVHHPFLPPAEYQREFRDEPVSDRESVQLRRKFIEEPDAITAEEYETFIDLYDAEIRFNDAEIGRLLDNVETAWGDEVLIGFTADHGDHFLEHGFFGGARGRDVKCHVPLFVTGWDDAGSYDELVGLTDLPATLIDAAGLEIPESYRGKSLRRLVFDDEWDRAHVDGGWDDDDGKHVTIRDREWRYIERPDGSRELYSTAEKFEERTNVVGDVPEEANRLAALADDHRRDVSLTSEEELERPDMDEEVKERLRRLGYKE